MKYPEELNRAERRSFYSMVKCDSTHKRLQSLKADLKLSLKLVNFYILAKYKHGRHHSQTPGEPGRTRIGDSLGQRDHSQASSVWAAF